MTLQIDPAFKAAYRETQGQPVDAVGRQETADLIDRLTEVEDRLAARCNIQDDAGARAIDEAITALAEKNARIAELERLTDAIDEERRSALDLCLERNKELTALRAECEGLRAALEAAKNWLEYENSPMGAAEEAAYWRLRAKIDAALASLSQPAKGEREGGK